MNPSSSSDHRGSESPGETPVFLSEREPGSTGAQRLPCSVEWRTYTPTEEENKIFRECGSESFFSRCLPMALLGLIIIPIIFPKGSRFASSRVGLVPEIMLFGAVSYIVGQYSYLNACKEKFMNLRDSPIGKSLRQPHTFLLSQSVLNKNEPQPESVFQSNTRTKSQNTQSSDRPPSKVKKNKYGDSWEE
ncbi:OCIA domain-containing protein 1 isoform X1 [Astyanax mexicanus]|uniref:OCIA domain-containing protein 1 isoform X1 n=1 Tax=Astyanax mexicanus TaxID=7994 RepID=UPI0020CB1AA1|nr:OCIA domain-containing protein 1 isoform X1 [Astyanax mexicanus]